MEQELETNIVSGIEPLNTYFSIQKIHPESGEKMRLLSRSNLTVGNPILGYLADTKNTDSLDQFHSEVIEQIFFNQRTGMYRLVTANKSHYQISIEGKAK